MTWGKIRGNKLILKNGDAYDISNEAIAYYKSIGAKLDYGE